VKCTIQNIFDEVEHVFSKQKALARSVKMYLCPRYTGQRLKDIDRHFDIGESGVSQASRRVIQKKKEDKQFIKRIEKIEKKISSK
jgi:chromosomal replication initiation ATPase DnaA